MSGHRRIATDLFLAHRPKAGRKWSPVEALIQLDLDDFSEVTRSLREYSRLFVRSTDWCRTLIRSHVEHKSALKSGGSLDPADDDRTLAGQSSDTFRTRSEIQNKNKIRRNCTLPDDPARLDVPSDLIDSIRAAFALHGRVLRSFGPARVKALRARLREGRTAEELVSAVHGYMYAHRNSKSPSFDPWDTFTPETVFRPSNVEKYIEAAAEAAAAGLQPPFKPDPVLSKNERVWADALENGVLDGPNPFDPTSYQ